MKKIIELSVVIISISSIVLFIVGFYKQGILFFGDTELTYHFAEKYLSFDKNYVWVDYSQGGSFDFNKFQGFYLRKLIYLFNIAINNLYLFSYLWFFLTYFFYMFTFYFAIKQMVVFFTKKNVVSISLILALYSFLNGVTILYGGQILTLLSFIMINVFLIFFLKNIKHCNNYNKNNLFFLFIMSLALSESLIYIQNTFLLIAIFCILILFYFKTILYRKIYLIQILIVGSITFLLNTPWIFPVVSQILIKSTSIGSLVNYDTDIGLIQAKGVSMNILLADLFRSKSYHVVFFVKNSIITILSYIPVSIVIISLIRLQKKFLAIVFASTLSFALFLSYGFHPLTEKAYSIFWNHVPLFNTFRTVMKFSFIYIYILIFFLAFILASIKNEVIKLLLLFALFFTAIAGLSYFKHEQISRSLVQYKIPSYYFDIKKGSKYQNDTIGNTLLLPQTNWQTQYLWAPPKIDGMNILPFFLNNKILNNGAQYTPDPQFIFNDYTNFLFQRNDVIELKALTKYRNIKSIAFQNDIRFPNDGSAPDSVNTYKLDKKQTLNTLDNNLCSKIERTGEIYFCIIKSELFESIINIKNSLIFVNSQPGISFKTRTTPSILVDLNLSKFANNKTIVFDSNNLAIKTIADYEVYPTAQIADIKDCGNEQPCRIHLFENVSEGNYIIYYVPKTIIEDRFISDFPVPSIMLYNDLIPSYKAIWQEKPPTTSNYENITLQENKSQSITLQNLVGVQQNNTNIGGKYYLIKTKNVNSLNISKTTTKIYKKNSTNYEISLQNVLDGQILTFAQNYHEGWKLNDGNHTIETNHFIADGYGNGWKLNRKAICQNNNCINNPDGTFNTHLSILFEPQKYFLLGLGFSIATIVSMLIITVFSFLIKLKQRWKTT